MLRRFLLLALSVSAASAKRVRRAMQTDLTTLDSNVNDFRKCERFKELQAWDSVVIQSVNGTSHTLQLGECIGGGANGIVFHLAGYRVPAIVKIYEFTLIEWGGQGEQFRTDAPQQFQIAKQMLDGPLSAHNTELADHGKATMTQPLLAGKLNHKWHAQVWSSAPGKNLQQIFDLSPAGLDPQVFASVGVNLFAALYYLGAKGMWHNDLQACNIMWFSEDGEQILSITDFDGLSSTHCPMQMDQTPTDLTLALEVLQQIAQRTPPFISPDGAEISELPVRKSVWQPLAVAPDKKGFIEGSFGATKALGRKFPHLLPAFELMVAAHRIDRKKDPHAYLSVIESIAETLAARSRASQNTNIGNAEAHDTQNGPEAAERRPKEIDEEAPGRDRRVKGNVGCRQLPPALLPGATMCVDGTRLADRNGKRGLLLSFVPEAQRWRVRFEDGQELNIRPECLSVETHKFCKGERVTAFSTGAQQWLHALIVEAFHTDCTLNGYSIKAGTLLVADSRGQKFFVLPEHVGNLIQKT